MARPAKFESDGNLRRAVVKLIREHGLTGAQEKLVVGVKYKKSSRAKRATTVAVYVSLPTLGKIAKSAGVKLSRGRRAA